MASTAYGTCASWFLGVALNAVSDSANYHGNDSSGFNVQVNRLIGYEDAVTVHSGD
jgi:hypothetical protein